MVSATRRDFLAAAGGLVLGFSLPLRLGGRYADAAPAQPVLVEAFLRIAPDDTITVLVNHSEMGQGVWTSLPMLIAEELEVDVTKIRIEHAPAAPAYFHAAGRGQRTGGSSSTRGEFDRLRKVGATARAMLIQAAAAHFRAPASELRARAGSVLHGSARVSYGKLAAAAARLPPPADVPLKDPKDWKIIGKPQRRLDSPEKVTGAARFGMDVQLPGLLTALVARAPVFGGTVKSFRADAALAVPGVRKVVAVPSGVAVVADHFWAANLGREALDVSWELGAGAAVDTDKHLAMLRDLVRKPDGRVTAHAGDVDAALRGAATRVDAQYEVPYLAHAPMEPLNATVEIDGRRCEIWTGTQRQTADQAAAAEILGIPPENVVLHTMFLGGGFGRRGPPTGDFVVEAVHVAKAAGAPVKTMWTREDDIRGGYYRPMFVHRIEAGLDAGGRPVAWRQTVAGQPLPRPPGVPDDSGIDGVADSPYLGHVPDHRVTLHSPPTPIPTLWWRSVGNTHTAFAMESFIDELAFAARRDPLELRRTLLAGNPRHLRALEAAAERAGWGKPAPAGVGRGLAVHASFGSFVAQVADVRIVDGKIRVDRVVCAVDCGVAVNPAGVVAQMQSGIVYGLSAALFGQIRIVDGRVQESNFDDYRVARMRDCPTIDVVICPSTDKMGGAGEPGTPPIAPAVANAVFALTGRRLRSLPFQLDTNAPAGGTGKPSSVERSPAR